MTVLYLAWQDRKNRGWFPVGRLVRRESEPVRYEFEYIRGAEEAKRLAGFSGIPGFPEMDKRYVSPSLFSTFRNRAMNPRRPDRLEYLRHLGLDGDGWDEVSELAVSGGRIQSDNFEAFPEIAPDADGRFASRFTLHGLRHTNPDSIRRSESLTVGEPLVLSLELNNPFTGYAVSVNTRDHYTLGWLPHYLVHALHRDSDNAWLVTDVEARIERVNPDAPLSHRALASFSGRLPAGVSPMAELEQYQPIAVSE